MTNMAKIDTLFMATMAEKPNPSGPQYILAVFVS